MHPPLVSIVIPTYNRAHLIEETLNSVRSQTYTNWECIVVDDGSTDKTEELLATFCAKDSRIQYHHRPVDRPKGANACRNYGFELSKGEYVNWLDSDDLLVENHIEHHLKIHQNYATDLVITKAEKFQGTTTNTKYWSQVNSEDDLILDMITNKVLWPICGVSWNKEKIEGFPFDEDLFSSQEWTAHLKKIIKGSQYKISNESTVLVRIHNKRIGTNYSEKKFYSTFNSRLKILLLLYEKKILNLEREKHLLNTMFSSLRECLNHGYYKLLLRLIRMLIININNFTFKKEVVKTIIFSLPIYLITKRGERLFKIS